MVEDGQKALRDKLASIHMEAKVIENTLKNKKVTERIIEIIDLAALGETCDKVQGNLLYTLATKLPPSCTNRTEICVNLIKEGKWTKVKQLDEAIKFMKANNEKDNLDEAELH